MTSDQYFTTQCLRPALRLIEELKNDVSKSSEHETAVSDLERLVALHSVLPLRSLFLAERATQWKARTKIITWEDVKDLHSVIAIMLVGSASAVDSIHDNLSASILQYYNIVTRAVPRATIRRMQQEQPWLDCMFCVCAYLGEPRLLKMVFDETGQLQIVHNALELGSFTGISGHLERLFMLATDMGVKLSLPVLLYFMTAAVENDIDHATWLVVGRIVEQDVNVLVPNSGLFDTTILLDKILDAISNTNSTTPEVYALVRDSLIRPLLQGFTQARDLRGFASLWSKGLQGSVQQRASGYLEYGQTHLSLVWEDDMLFRDFVAAAKALTSSTFAHAFAAETLALLQQAVKRIGPTSDIMSHVAITTSLLSARPEDFNVSTLEGILAAAASALARRSDYQLQRWRLWRLLCQCELAAGSSTSAHEELQRLDEKKVMVSLSTLAGSDIAPRSYARDASFQEALECFQLIVWKATTIEGPGTDAFESELEHIIKLFSDAETSKGSRSRAAYLEIATSCTGILLQHSQILLGSVSGAARLIAAMIQNIRPSGDARQSTDLIPLIKTLLGSEEISSNSEMFNNCCSELISLKAAGDGLAPAARDILVSLPLQALKKSLAQKLAVILVTRVRNSTGSAASLDNVLADIGLLEMVIAVANVSVGKPKDWLDFIDLADHLLSVPGNPSSKSYQAALGCMCGMLEVLWSRCVTDKMYEDMTDGLTKLKIKLRASQVAPTQTLQSFTSVQTPDSPLDLSELRTMELEQLALRTNSQVSALGREKSSVLAELAEQDDLNSGKFLLLSAITCQISQGEMAEDPMLCKSLSSLATLRFALKAETAADLSLALETCKIVLDKHPSVITQYTIDTLISSITALTSPSTITTLTSSNPSAIFNRLCSLIGFTLNRHRKRLGGRYHLLLPALQGLIKCLFFAGTSTPAPSQTKSQVLFIRGLPSWLRTSKSPLPPSSAEHLTRLLTTICDPSTSSIRKRSKSNALNDETKKAKSLAGQYMQYLIMTYCSCSLHGRIPSSSKEKLMPGLYSVMDVMDREVMRGMNGAMDSSGRAIFKGLYDEYQRFGRWDRK